jgi:hypothetical protein
MKGLSPIAVRNVRQFQLAPMGNAYFTGRTQVLVGFADETGRILAMGPSLNTAEVQERIGGGVVIPFRIELENLVGTSGTSYNLTYKNTGNELISRNFYDNLGEAAMAFQTIRNSHLGAEGWLKRMLSASALGTGRLSLISQGISLASGIGLIASLLLGYGFIPMAVVWSLSSGYVFSAAHPARSLRQRLALWGVGIVLGGLSLIPVGMMHFGFLGALAGAVGVPASWAVAAVLGGVLDAFGHVIYNALALRFGWEVASTRNIRRRVREAFTESSARYGPVENLNDLFQKRSLHSLQAQGMNPRMLRVLEIFSDRLPEGYRVEFGGNRLVSSRASEGAVSVLQVHPAWFLDSGTGDWNDRPKEALLYRMLESEYARLSGNSLPGPAFRPEPLSDQPGLVQREGDQVQYLVPESKNQAG